MNKSVSSRENKTLEKEEKVVLNHYMVKSQNVF